MTGVQTCALPIFIEHSRIGLGPKSNNLYDLNHILNALESLFALVL